VLKCNEGCAAAAAVAEHCSGTGLLFM